MVLGAEIQNIERITTFRWTVDILLGLCYIPLFDLVPYYSMRSISVLVNDSLCCYVENTIVENTPFLCLAH